MMSTSTGAPAALAFSEGANELTNGYDSGHASNATRYGRRYQPATAAAVDALIFLVSHHTPHF